MHTTRPQRPDCKAYLDRIGYAGDLRVGPVALAGLHLAHATHIPFENLDILFGRPIHLDLPSLQAKLVAGRRGGYCFEHNLLFAAVLRELGFAVTPLAARVRLGTQSTRPRTHMLLLVDLEHERWIADVGFGGEGLLLPVPFATGGMSRQFAWTYRAVAESDRWVLQSLRDGSWLDLYAFTLEPQELVDYEMANYYMSTHPQSPFVQTLTAQLPTPEVRYLLRDRELAVDKGGAVATRTIADDDELVAVLAGTFGITLPAGTRFRRGRRDSEAP